VLVHDAFVKPLRIGIAGAGSWARQAHVPGFQSCANVELVAICDLDLARAQQVGAEAGIPAAYRSTEEMMAGERLDLVSIVTPDDCHVADAKAAIAAGAHVLCEKPLATSVEDARSLAAIAALAGVQTKVGFAMRYSPAMMKLRELVVSGELGTPRLLEAFQQNGQFLDPATPFHWKMDRQRTGGGAIVEYGIHTIDLARWIVGEVGSVCATGRTWTPRRSLADGSGFADVDVDDSTAWMMEFANGAIGVCHAGWATIGRPPGLEVRVFGSRCAARCVLSDELPNAESLEIAGPDGHFHPAAIPARFSALLPESGPWWYRFPAHLIRRFVAEIGARETVGPTFADGVAAQEILEALLVSMRERRWVDVTRPHPSPLPSSRERVC
jgi:predicted dehydrogenase